MNKNALMIGVIVAILALGGGWYLLSQGKKTQESGGTATKEEIKKADLEAKLTASATTVGVSENPNSPKIVNITIDYTNNTSVEMANVQLSLSISPHSMGTLDSPSAKFNQQASTQATSVFDAQSVSAGGKESAALKVYSSQKGTYTLTVTVKSGSYSATTNSVTITVS